MNEIERIQQRDLEGVRWDVMISVYHGKTLGTSDSISARVVRTLTGNSDIEDIREIFEYLEGHGLVVIDRREAEWVAKITVKGVDVYQGNLPCPVGVGKPK